MPRRPLTLPEEARARRVFQEPLPYGRIFISDWLAWHRRPCVFLTGWGRRSRSIVHLGPQGFADALRTPCLQALLLQELTQVWQGSHQRWAWRYVRNSLRR